MIHAVQTGFDEMLKDASHGVYDFTKNGKCSECGSCCSNVLPMTNKEINQVRAYIKKHNIEKQTHCTKVLAKQSIDCQCPFLDYSRAEHKCLIYPVRPMVCREFICNKWDALTKRRIAREPVKLINVAETFYPDTNKILQEYGITIFQ